MEQEQQKMNTFQKAVQKLMGLLHWFIAAEIMEMAPDYVVAKITIGQVKMDVVIRDKN